MAETPVFKLNLPADSTRVADTPMIMRDDAQKIEAVLIGQEADVNAAKDAAQTAEAAARAAAGLVDAPASEVVVSTVKRDGAAFPYLREAFGITESACPEFQGPLKAALQMRHRAPATIIFAGSSTTAAAGDPPAQRWVNMIASAAGANAVLSEAQAVAAAPLSTGINVINAGIGGTTSANYITEARIPGFGTIDPSLIVHMVGSNDAANGMHPATYEANLRNVLDALDATIDGPVGHLLIHSYQRYDVALKYPWEDYRAALWNIAHDRTNTTMLDISGAFAAVGVPGDDPLDFIQNDLIHMRYQGHIFMTSLLGPVLDLPAKHAPVSSRLWSDSFSGGNTETILGRSTDQQLGGAVPTVWTGADALKISNGKAVPRGFHATWFEGAQATSSNYEFGVKLDVLPTDPSGFYIDVRRQATVGSPDGYRARVNPNGDVILTKRTGGSNTDLVAGINITVPALISLQVMDDVLQLSIDREPMATIKDSSVSAPGYAGLAGVSAAAGFQIDSVYLDYLS